MKKVMVICLVLGFGSWVMAQATADYLFIHNNDSVTIKRPGENYVEFQYYSISGRSRIDIACAETGSGTKIFKDTDGWKSATCGGQMATITIREMGGGNPGKDSGGDIPSDSDVVIRRIHGAAYLHHEDSYQKGKTCPICKRKLTW